MSPRHWSVVIAFLVAAWAMTPAVTRAQEQPLQAANGAALYLGSVEGLMIIGMPIAIAVGAAAPLPEVIACVVLLPLCAIFAPSVAADLGALIGVVLLGAAAVLAIPPSIAGVGGAEGWDADGSLVLTTGFHGLASTALVGSAFDLAAGGEGAAGVVIGGLVGGAAMSTYAALRHAELTHDPRAGTEANFLMWSPPVAMLVSALAMLVGQVDPEIALFVTGLSGMIAQAVCIGLAEQALSEPAPMMMGP